jgi:cell division transport system ATP-binding protein
VPLIRFHNVGLRYGQGPEVLRDVTFTLEPGSFQFLTGPSGAGKTSLLRLLYLAQRPTRGSIVMFGTELHKAHRQAMPDIRRRIGVVFQDYRLIEQLSVLDNVALPLRLAGQREDRITRDVSELLRWVGLGDKLQARPSVLSGGEQQRCAIARAVVSNPALLLADEPTGNLDDAAAVRLLRLFEELHKGGAAVLIATHNTALMQRFPHRRLHLRDNTLVSAPALAA